MSVGQQLLQGLEPKRTGETINYAVDFANVLASGVTLSTAANWVATVKSGTDASPSSIVSGSASISGTKSVQAITAGTDGVVYYLKVSVTTSDSQTLEELVTLEVQDKES